VASLGDYWNFFVLAEELGFRSLLAPLLDLKLQNALYYPVWLIGFVYLCELVVPWRKQQRKLREGVWLDLFYTLANFLLFASLISDPVFVTVQLAFHHALYSVFGLQLHAVIHLASWPLWSRCALLFLIGDLLSYFGHRLLHYSNFLWNFHKVHHSSKRLDVLNAVRLHWVEKLYYDFFVYVPLALIGFEAQQVLFVALASTLVCAFTHANVRVPLGPLKYLINNPQLHLWHHALEVPAQRNVNYGSVLSLWDVLFGTVYLPDDRSDLPLGFAGDADFPTTLWGQQLYPLSAIAAKLWRR
jgi:sterol desaturase/sphingolipid hydroxylase (fatty acid hydroxylase superfamily)